MANRGMLGELFSPSFRTLRDEELAEEKIHQFQAQDPFRAMAHASYSGGTLAGKGLGRTIAAATGRDPRTPLERNTEAVEAAKAQVSQLGLDPDKPESIDQFYRQVIVILQRQGLAAEAMEVGKEYAAEKHKLTKEGFELRDLQRKEKKDIADADRSNQRLEIDRLKAQPEFAKLLTMLGETNDPVRATAITQRLEYMSTRAGKGFKYVPAGDRVEVRDPVTNDLIETIKVGMTPVQKDKDADKQRDAESAYSEYLAGLQKQYDAAVQLHNHPGVEGITGRLGRLVGEEGVAGQTATTVASAAARAALALHRQVTGGTFLAGLAKLKAASKTGATGLGAVSEREGDKVQSDAAALSREQEAADYRKQLGIYINEMEGFAQRMAAAAQADRIAPRNLATKPLAAPKGGRPVAAPQPAPGAPKVEEWERGPDGKPRRKR